MVSLSTECTSWHTAVSMERICSFRSFTRSLSLTSPTRMLLASTTGNTVRLRSRILRISTSGPSFFSRATSGLSIIMELAVIILERSTFSTKRATYASAGSVNISSDVPVCTISPSFIMAMRSPSLMASFKSWVIKTIVFFILACNISSSSCICTRISGSRAEKASSINSTSGLLARARAIPTRCCIPPESCPTI